MIRFEWTTHAMDGQQGRRKEICPTNISVAQVLIMCRSSVFRHRDLVELGLPVSVHPCFLSPEAADEILTTMIRDPTFEQPVRVVAGRETRPNRLQKWIKDAEEEVDDSPTNLLPAFQDALLRVEAFVNEEGGKRGILTACTKWRPTFWIANCYRGASSVSLGPGVTRYHSSQLLQNATCFSLNNRSQSNSVRHSDGTESLAAHSDDLAQLGPRPIIAGLTFGGKFEWYLVHQHNFSLRSRSHVPFPHFPPQRHGSSACSRTMHRARSTARSRSTCTCPMPRW